MMNNAFRYLFQMDHYDAYNYIMIGPISIIASLLFIMLNVTFKEARRFPGNLLIIISVAEIGLCIHWFLSGLFTKFILGTTHIDEDGFFCKMNSHIAFISANVEYWFQLAFLISIITMFRNTMKEIKHKFMFILIPSILVTLSWVYITYSGGLGKNIYGTCSVNNLDRPGTFFIIANSIYLLVVLITLWVLHNFKKQSRNEITIKDDFYKFYTNYTVLIFILYAIIGITFAVSKAINDAFKTLQPGDDDYNFYLNLFFISRIGNNVKIFIPFMTFLLRLRDPFIKKLIFKFLRQKQDNSINQTKTDISREDDSVLVFEDDFAINAQIKTIRTRMVRTMLRGLNYYYDILRFQFNSITDETLLNQIQHEIHPFDSDIVLSTIKETDIEEQRNTSMDENLKKLYECTFNSLYGKKFSNLIDSLNNPDMAESFDLKRNKNSIKKSGESDGGAGGEFFLITYDKRFIVKTISEEEKNIFGDFIEIYSEYFRANKSSFIGKIIGVFEFNFKLTSQTTRVIVMENIFWRRPALIHRRYDIKGSSYKRCVLGKNSVIENKHHKIDKTLKDIDFSMIEDRIVFKKDIRDFLIEQLRKDVEFFKAQAVIDYSLLLGVIDMEFVSDDDYSVMKELEQAGKLFFNKKKDAAFIMGIIDYFQLYNLSKFFEKYSKKVINCNCKLDTSSQPSNVYAKRFMVFMEDIFVCES